MNRQMLGLGTTAAICAVAGFLLYRQWATNPAAPAAPAVPAVPATLPATAPPDEGADTGSKAVPEQVPDISLRDLQGKLRSLHEYRGQPTIINFWATWCIPCRREIPLLNELHRGHSREQLQIVGIAVDFTDAVRAYTAKTPLSYPLLVGEQDGVDAAAAFGMQLVLPFSVFVDGGERIVAVKVGELHREEADAILAAIADLGAGKQDLPATRQRIAEQLRLLSAERARREVKPS